MHTVISAQSNERRGTGLPSYVTLTVVITIPFGALENSELILCKDKTWPLVSSFYDQDLMSNLWQSTCKTLTSEVSNTQY